MRFYCAQFRWHSGIPMPKPSCTMNRGMTSEAFACSIGSVQGFGVLCVKVSVEPRLANPRVIAPSTPANAPVIRPNGEFSIHPPPFAGFNHNSFQRLDTEESFAMWRATSVNTLCILPIRREQKRRSIPWPLIKIEVMQFLLPWRSRNLAHLSVALRHPFF